MTVLAPHGALTHSPPRRRGTQRVADGQMGRREVFFLGAGGLAAVSVGLPALAGTSRRVFAPGGIALAGRDPVSYFSAAHPAKGKTQYALKWKGAIWLFASHENLVAFEADPRAYAPQFGGWCSKAMENGGRKVAADPDVFAIRDGRLYLFRSADEMTVWAAATTDFDKTATAEEQSIASGN